MDGKIVDPGCTTKSAFLHSETSWIFWIFRYRSQYFNTIPVNLDKFLQFLKNPRNSDQFSSSLSINIVKFAEKTRFFEKNHKKWQKFRRVFVDFLRYWAVQRCDDLVDLEKCWKMRLFSLSEASIQRRTSRFRSGPRVHYLASNSSNIYLC